MRGDVSCKDAKVSAASPRPSPVDTNALSSHKGGSQAENVLVAGSTNWYQGSGRISVLLYHTGLEFEVGSSNSSRVQVVCAHAAVVAYCDLLDAFYFLPFSRDNPPTGAVSRVLTSVDVTPHRMKVGSEQHGIDAHNGSPELLAGAPPSAQRVEDDKAVRQMEQLVTLQFLFDNPILDACQHGPHFKTIDVLFVS